MRCSLGMMFLVLVLSGHIHAGGESLQDPRKHLVLDSRIIDVVDQAELVMGAAEAREQPAAAG